MDDRRNYRFFWGVVIALLLLTRIPAAANYLSIDNVNLAFSLEDFDPLRHQPQPPGYPFFVAFGKIVNFVFRDAERTFMVISVLVSGLCLPVLFALAQRMFSMWVGAAGVILFLLNPVFWHSGIDGPLRPNLALFSLLTAYCAWRCWNGEKQFLYWGAVAVGVGSGFRPDLLVFLFPVWALSAWMGTRSIRAVIQGWVLMGAVVLVWVGALVWAVGGVREVWRLMVEYAIEQSRIDSVLMGAAQRNWLRQVNRLIIWNALAVVTWVWAVPIALRSKERVSLLGKESIFMLTWLVPGLVIQALIHVAAPGHTLFSIPALCLIGGYFISVAARSLETRGFALSGALALNVMLFLNFFPLPLPQDAVAGFWNSAKNAAAYGTFETSISQVRWLDDISRTALEDIKKLSLKDGPTLIISSDIHYQQWFMNWRIARYYLPDRDIWVIADQKRPMMAELVRREKTIEVRSGPLVTVPVPRGGRILWLLEHNNPFHKALAKVIPMSEADQLLYSDLPEDAAAFRALDFEFVPTEYIRVERSSSGVQ
ncbi:MAG: glycosyltransferase family 39 protein [Acidobacteria bacterium]|nr:glycosyltransferase family 39 protein [Acidobacteriota bacterium]